MDISQILVGSAWAQAAAEPALPGGAGMSPFSTFVPIILILVVFYVLLIRPQQKKIDEQEKMIKALRRGDRIVTSGGLHGKIVKVEGDDHIILEIADGINVKVSKPHVQALAAKTDPTTGGDGDEAEKKAG